MRCGTGGSVRPAFMLCLVYGSVADVTADKGSSLALLSAEMFLHCRTSLDRLSAQDVGPERWGCPICAARPGG